MGLSITTHLLLGLCPLQGMVPATEAETAQEPTQEPLEPDPAPRYLRLVETEGRLALELAVRSFRPADAGGNPTGAWIHLVSAMHVADRPFYETVQAFLDGRDVVLYERVEPAPRDPERLAALKPAARGRVAATERRMADLAARVARFERERGRLPAGLEELSGAMPAERFAARCRDAWGETIAYTAGEPFVLTSLGADGAAGGTGEDADLILDELPPLALAALTEERGMQGTLADALGLVFQLDGIDYTGTRWRNSDMSLEALQAELAAADIGVETFFSSMAGSSLTAKLAGGLLKLIGSTRSGSGMLKIAGLEVLSRADEVLAALPPEMAGLFEVLIERRNAVVVRDLRALLTSEPDVRTVAVFYGAAHMRDLEERLRKELGVMLVREHWVPAVQIRLADTGLSAADIRMLRGTIRTSLERTLRR
ncbi:MAG: hypothetical protein GY711_28705 [bacterium]|nr:hypothetical protein [bacterium]